MREEIDCATFEESVGELVLDLLEPAEQAALLHHAAECPRCQAELNSLSAIADQLATVAPECEPPVGFEARVVATFTAPATDGAAVHQLAPIRLARRRPLATALLAAAAAALLGVWAGHAIGTDASPAAAPATLAGTLADDAGGEHGWVLLTPTTDGRASLTMHLADLPRGTYRCLLVAADGTTTEVAAWPIDESGAGQWTISIAAPPASSTVVVVAGSGATVAAADLDAA